MSFIATQQGQTIFLKRILNFQPADNMVLHLFVNDKVPARTDTLSLYVECTTVPYLPKILTGSSWTFAIDVGTGNPVASYPTQTFTFTTTVTVFGFYLTDIAVTNLLLAERFSSTFTLPPTGGNIKINPEISFGSCI